MFGKSFMFVAIIGLTISTISALDVDDVCLIVVDKTAITDPQSCSNYYTCQGGKGSFNSCPTGLRYDKNNKKCTDKPVTGCIDLNGDPCDGAEDGTFKPDPNPELCSAYHYCTDGKSAGVGYCTFPENFNPFQQVCSTEYKCTSAQFELCNVIPDGVYFGDSTDCNKYQSCKDGALESGSCPDGRNFNVLNGSCDYSKGCRQTTSQVPTESPSVNPPKPCAENGTYVSDETCSGYLYCDGKIYIKGKCNDNKFFNGTNCVDRNSFKCEYDRCDGMGGPGKKYANEDDGSCKGYLICSDKGTTVTSGKCPNGLYFDELQQLCVDDIVKYKSCSSDDAGQQLETTEAPSNLTTTTLTATTEETTTSTETTITTTTLPD